MNRNISCGLYLLVAFLSLALSCAPHARTAADDPCDPNPCDQEHKTRCSDDGSGQAVCTCEPGYQDPGDGTCQPSGDPCSLDTTCASQNRQCVVEDGHATCTGCLDGYKEQNQVCIRQIPAGREITSGAASVQGGGYRMEVQIGHPIGQAPAGDGTTRIEGAAVVKK